MKPSTKDVGNTSGRIQFRSYLDDLSYRSGKAAFEEQVFYRLVLMTENTLTASMPITLNKIIFGQDDPSTQIPTKDLSF
jgi:hypothetical protein